MLKLKLNTKTVGDLLRGQEMQSDLKRRASAIASAAGDGFESETDVGPNRAHASVWTATREAVLAEANDRALTRALDAGR